MMKLPEWAGRDFRCYVKNTSATYLHKNDLLNTWNFCIYNFYIIKNLQEAYSET
jgi:hypothetical protein